MIKIPRSANGRRHFNQTTIETLQAISYYRLAGIGLRNIKLVLDSNDNKNFTVKWLQETKRSLDQQIEKLQTTRKYLTRKIAFHKQLALQEKQVKSNDEKFDNAA